jgi:hypothetical protein
MKVGMTRSTLMCDEGVGAGWKVAVDGGFGGVAPGSVGELCVGC